MRAPGASWGFPMMKKHGGNRPGAAGPSCGAGRLPTPSVWSVTHERGEPDLESGGRRFAARRASRAVASRN
eukprot:8592181-Pyramimonas_sp.AAC.1